MTTASTKRTLRVLDKTGDTRYEWDIETQEGVEKVREEFEKLVGAQKYLAYTQPADGSTGETIREFDPEVKGDIILTPQMQGG